MHNIIFEILPGNKTEKQIKEFVKNCVTNSGDGYGTTEVVFFRHSPFDCYDEAYEYIEQKNQGWYPGFAVKYYDSDDFTNKKIEALLEKLKKNKEAKIKYDNSVQIYDRQADYVGCRYCGSKINRQFLKNTNHCPVCHNDLRSEKVQDNLRLYDDRRKKLENDIKQEKIKHKNKAEMKWLVKFEYHS